MDDVTLIVKASNQQFEDQTVHCEPSWTIRRLKGHLTEVHPGKPSTDEQKLIYSGQLLGDNVVLKDVLRNYDGQTAHTVHLVFQTKNFPIATRPKDSGPSTSKTMAPKSTNSESTSSASASTSRITPAAHAESSSNSNTTVTNDGLRHRNVPASSSTLGASGSPGMPPIPLLGTVNSVPNSAAPFGAAGIPPASADFIMSQHLAMQSWMQQAYMQYLNQYMNVISNGQNPQTVFASAPMTANMPTVGQSTGTQLPASSVPVNNNPMLIPSLPNLAYYPYMSTMNSSPNLPTASSIPAPIITASSAGVSPSQPPTLPGPAEAGPSISPAVPSVSSNSGPSSADPSTGSSQVAGTSQSASVVDGTATAVNHQVAGAAADGQVAAGAAGPAAAAAPARRFPNIVVEEQENRDWLDIFFSLCRVGILITVVILYSSPQRCLTVFFIGITLYLYQMGFFRNNNANRLERARRIVVQQINNAHGVRPNVVPRVPVPQARGDAVAVPNADNAAAATANSSDNETESTNSSKPESNESTEPAGSGGSASSSIKEQSTPDQSALTGAETNENDDQALLNSSLPEANRFNVNDTVAFLRTLVLSFFTSIIPDTPAA